MKNKVLFFIWGGLYILCALLGFIPSATGFGKVLLSLTAAAFFVPGWILFYRGQKDSDLPLLRAVRTVSLLSLCVTVLFLVLFFMTAGKNAAASEMLYGFLVFFSAPMMCSQFWVGSLFLWACLLIASFSAIRKAQK